MQLGVPSMGVQVETVPQEVLRKAGELLSSLRIPPEVLSILQRGAPLAFARGDAIFTQKSEANVAYCVVSGLVKVYFPLDDGSRIIVDVAGAGDLIGLIHAPGAHGHRVQLLQAEAMSKASVAIFTREQVVSIFKEMTPAGLVEVFQDVSTMWSKLLSWYINFLGLSFRDRLLRVFQYLANRYGVRESRGVRLTIELCHGDIAEMIASSRPMVSRLIDELLREGKLARQGRHYILRNHASFALPFKRKNNSGDGRSSPLSLVPFAQPVRLPASNMNKLARHRAR